MASGFSVMWGNKINDKVWRATDFTPATSYWIALFINATAGTYLRANDIASAQEVAGGSYARVEVRGSTGNTWGVSSGGLSVQSNDITFPAATGNWGSIISVAVMDASTAGNVVLYGDLPVPKPVSTPDIFKVPAGYFQSQF